jgi:hypothetical protein
MEPTPEQQQELTPEQQLELHDAEKRAGSFLGAAKVAAFNGWTIGFFAGASILFGLFSRTSFFVGVGLAVVARNEFVGRRRLRAFDPSGLELLWRNQVGFMALIIGYCLWTIYSATAAPSPEMAAFTADVAELLGEDIDGLIQSLTVTLYAVVIVATGIFQGLNARFYFVRVTRLREFLRDTPSWVVDVQRAD